MSAQLAYLTDCRFVQISMLYMVPLCMSIGCVFLKTGDAMQRGVVRDCCVCDEAYFVPMRSPMTCCLHEATCPHSLLLSD